MALTSKLTAIADAIRAKTGETGKMTLEQMPGKIGGISGGGGGFDTSQIISTMCMFSESDAVSIDVSGLDTSNVVAMDEMFSNCPNLKSLDLSSFKTERVIQANRMFYNCSKLEVLVCFGFLVRYTVPHENGAIQTNEGAEVDRRRAGRD